MSYLGNNLPLAELAPSTSNINVPLFGSVGDIHIDTLVLSWICMGGILAFSAFVVKPMLVSDGPGNNIQAAAEGLYDFCKSIAEGQIGPKWRGFFPLVAAIFIFVLIANLVGILPWKWIAEVVPNWPHDPHNAHELFEMAAPSTDFNVTLGLAAIALITYIGSGFAAMGGKYLSAYKNPVEWLDLLIRPSTLALRLMLVITADELLRMVSLLVVPWFLPVGVMAFEIFIALIQAYVFSLLTSIYVGLTLSHADEHHH